MQKLCQLTSDKLNEIARFIPLKDLIKQNNALIELLLKSAMVRVLSDRNVPPPVVFPQAEDEFLYAQSNQSRYNDEVQE